MGAHTDLIKVIFLGQDKVLDFQESILDVTFSTMGLKSETLLLMPKGNPRYLTRFGDDLNPKVFSLSLWAEGEVCLENQMEDFAWLMTKPNLLRKASRVLLTALRLLESTLEKRRTSLAKDKWDKVESPRVRGLHLLLSTSELISLVKISMQRIKM